MFRPRISNQQLIVPALHFLKCGVVTGVGYSIYVVLTKHRGVTDLTSAPSRVTIHFTSTAIYCSLLTSDTRMPHHIVPDPADVSVDIIRQQHDCLFH